MSVTGPELPAAQASPGAAVQWHEPVATGGRAAALRHQGDIQAGASTAMTVSNVRDR